MKVRYLNNVSTLVYPFLPVVLTSLIWCYREKLLNCIGNNDLINLGSCIGYVYIGHFMNESNELIELDVDLLNEYAQSLGYPIVKKMFSLYEQQVMIYLQEIEESLCSGNVKLWQDRCHKMKGAAGSVGLKALYTRLKNMEKTNANKEGRAQQLAELNMHNKQAMAEFMHWLASL